MKVLFCHDGPLRKDNEGNYYGVAHNDEMFKRYFHIGDELTVLIRVKQISNDECTNLSKITLEDRFKVVECPNFSSFKGLLKNYKKANMIIEQAVKETDYVVVRNSQIGSLAIKYIKKYKKPYLMEVVSCVWDGLRNHSLKGKIIAPFRFLKVKKEVKEAPYVVYVTNNFLQKRYPTNGRSVNCSNVALTEFDSRILDRRIDKTNSINEKDKIVLGTTAAVNVRYKGQQYVIKALGKLKEEGITHYEYQLVGGGDQSYLKSVAKKYNVADQVKFLGVMPHNKVFEWLETIDIYVQPSRQEGLPRALIEAMSRALPAFGANTAGIPELLESEYIFSNTRRNVKEICKILKSFDKEKMLEQAKRNYEESKKYDKEIIENRRRLFFERFKNLQ